MLLQEGVDGLEHPFALFSCKMVPSEINYPVHDKEMLAILSLLKEWQNHLNNATFPLTIILYHKSLEYFKTPCRLNQHQSQWYHDLALYKYKIEYKRVQVNFIVDMLIHEPKKNL